jgi:PAS domain S-box-containing protein
VGDGNGWAGTGDASSYYQQVVESITDYGVIGLDEKGVVCSWNPGAQRLEQYAAEEIIGRPVNVFYPESDVASGLIEKELATAAETGRYETEGWRIRKDGTQFRASVMLTPIRDAMGAPLGYVKVVHDLTERFTQQIALHGYEQLIDSITDYGIIRLDPDGRVRSWNPGAGKLRGYAEAEVIGRHVSMFYSEQDLVSGQPERELAAAVRDGRVETEGWRVRKDGSRFWANDVLTPIRDQSGTLVGFVKVSRDLSERRKEEQLVARQRDEILELSTPVIQVWDKVLVLPIIGTLDSNRAARLTESLLEAIARYQAEVAILDISGVPTIDTDVAQHLLKTVEASRLMGAASVLSGVRPETAQAIVHLGIDLGSVRSRNSLKEALQLALRLVGSAGPAPRAGADV